MTDRQKDRQRNTNDTYIITNRQTVIYLIRRIDEQTNRQIDRQTVNQADGRTDRQKGRITDKKTEKVMHINDI